MKFVVEWIDVRAFLQIREQPVYMIKRPLAHGDNPKGNVFNVAEIAKVGEHWVPQADVFNDAQWSFTKAGDMVRVPIVAYKVDRTLASILGLGLQIGLAAVADLRNYTSDVPHTVILVIGHECTDLAPAENLFRCYVGLALQTK